MQLDKQSQIHVYQLVPIDGKSHETFVLKKRQILIGRSETCDIIIRNSYVSTIHASITFGADQIQIVDLNSTNGTFINGQRITVSVIKQGDKVKFGKLEFEVRSLNKDNKLQNVGEFTRELTSTFTKGNITDELENTPLEEVKFEKHNTAELEFPKGKMPPLPSSDDLESNFEKTKPDQEYSIDDLESDSLSLNDVKQPSLLEKDIKLEVKVTTPIDFNPAYEFSEFIFEDVEELYPIFNYNIERSSIEVIILLKEVVLSVDYFSIIPSKKFLVGSVRDEDKITLDTLKRKEKLLFIEIDENKNIKVNAIPGYNQLYMPVGGSAIFEPQKAFEIKPGDFLRFNKGHLQVIVRRVVAPPEVKNTPFFGRDKTIKRFMWPLLGFAIILMFVVGKLKVDEDLRKKKTPERIAKILYKNEPKPIPVPVEVEAPIESEKVVEAAAEKPTTPTQPEKQVAKEVPKKTVSKNKVTAPQKTQAQPVAEVKKEAFSLNVSNALTKINESSNSFNKLTAKVENSNRKLVLGSSGAPTKAGKVEIQGASGGQESLIGDTNTMDNSTSAKGIGGSGKQGFSYQMSPKKTIILGSMDPEVVRSKLQEYIPEFRNCYEQVLAKHGESVKGVIVLDFDIGKTGHVGRSNVSNEKSGQTFPKQGVDCIRNVLKSITFPEPKGGGIVQVKQPLNFEVKN